jgi:hypothetical protein
MLYAQQIIPPGGRLHALVGSLVELIQTLHACGGICVAGRWIEATKKPIYGGHSGATKRNTTDSAKELLGVNAYNRTVRHRSSPTLYFVAQIAVKHREQS